MPADFKNEVVRYLRRKNASGLENVSWIGSEQRFVGALLNSNVNNLEEQYILGTDTYTITYQDTDDNQIIEKHFCKTDTTPDDASDHYKLVTILYKTAQEQTDFVFDGEVFTVNAVNKMVFGTGVVPYPSITSVYGIDKDLFSFNNDYFDIYPQKPSLMREDKLYYVKSGQPDLLILTKTTEVKYTTDNKMITHEKIVNALH